jgi:hypothetical protein
MTAIAHPRDHRRRHRERHHGDEGNRVILNRFFDGDPERRREDGAANEHADHHGDEHLQQVTKEVDEMAAARSVNQAAAHCSPFPSKS